MFKEFFFICAIGSIAFMLPAQQISPNYASKQLSSQFTLSNGLRFVVISDPNAEVSAASLTIKAGQREAPFHAQGLPHLLEHIVFLGSKQYPQIDSWDNFFKSAGGWSNGSTRSGNTRYHFQIQNSLFRDGLGRLVDIIESPMILTNAVDIGLSEVNEEFESGRNNDWQGILSVMKDMTIDTNSARKFGIGNHESLGTEARNIEPALKKFHSRFYVANNMALAIYTNEPQEDIIKFIKSEFGSLESGEDNVPKYIPLHSNSQLATLISIDSESNRISLDMRFEVPNRLSKTNFDTSTLVIDLIGHEAPGSIFHYLKSKGLAYSLSASFQGDYLNEVLNIYIDLTPKGHNELGLVMGSVFAYVNKISSGVPLYVQKELQLVRERVLDKAVSKEPGDWLSDISDTLLHFETVNSITHKGSFDLVSSMDLRGYLSHLTPSNMQAFVTSKTDKVYKRSSSFYDRQFSISKIGDTIDKSIPQLDRDNFHFPSENPYLSQDKQTRIEFPLEVSIVDVKKGEMSDEILIQLEGHRNRSSSQTRVMSLLLIEKLRSALGDKAYFAAVADYKLETHLNHQSIGIVLSGQGKLLAKYAHDILRSGLKEVSAVELERIKDISLRKYNYNLRDKAFKLAILDSDSQVDKRLSPDLIPELISKVTQPDFNDYITEVKESIIVVNPTGKPILTGYFTNNKMHKQNRNWHTDNKDAYSVRIGVDSQKKALSHTLVTRYASPIDEASLRVLKELTTSGFSDLMRTQKKIAYIANSKMNRLSRASLSYVVESSSTEHSVLVKYTHDYLHNQLQTRFDGISEASFKQAKTNALLGLGAETNGKSFLRAISYEIEMGYKPREYTNQVIKEIESLELSEAILFLSKFQQSVPNSLMFKKQN
ncbi:insulinase family protein [Shewanella sp. 10N.286.52.B9]|uniref:insulinase family protein n=1 Tax=Shewanella sp. 10N.286.52.B9 TaxID=1880837 RepID=UPI000C85DD3F|nr:insulinase family protein [Shewanella sp. 10N.286.52.B9]PMG39634.1 hypothetical protein BCU91_14640 [Shewanella sp. 10N.286.52.B9]